jgi:hypothetical protein
MGMIHDFLETFLSQHQRSNRLFQMEVKGVTSHCLQFKQRSTQKKMYFVIFLSLTDPLRSF